MDSIVRLLSDWEIQLLVLLSFTLQIFLFFIGGLRRYTTNARLRFSMWIAYLGADLVSFYALGFLSRHKDVTIGQDTLREVHPLSFLWAPFLLMHLGGQVTITAFSIEDNNLWLRHLLNLAVQVALTLYVFWKSVDLHNLQILIPGIFLFVAGIIKYGERTLALMYGDLKSIYGSNDYKMDARFSKLHDPEAGYLDIVSFVLHSAPGIRELFAGHTLHQMDEKDQNVLTSHINLVHFPKLLEIELGLMYDDLYTKAMVLRTKGGIIIRCVSQVSLVVAFVMFQVSNMKRYNGIDLAITYVLFTGAFFLEVCAIFIVLMSPWTWAWLKAKKCHGINRMSSFLLSSNIGWPERRPLWSNSMGQYNFLSYVGCEQSRLSKLAKKVVRKMASFVGAGKGKSSLLWISKLLDKKCVKVDKEIMECVVRMVYQYSSHGSSMDDQRWQNFGPLKKLLQNLGASFGYGIVLFHMFTEAHLSTYSPPVVRMDTGTTDLITVCQKLSNYMFYLLVIHPEMLPVSGATEPTLKFFLRSITEASRGKRYKKDEALGDARSQVKEILNLDHEVPTSRETLMEIRDMWTMLLIYSAGKSKADTHAAQLSKGGELLTFAWLLMAHQKLGDVGEPYDFFSPSAPAPWVPRFQISPRKPRFSQFSHHFAG